ncbi:MAG TPA: 3',5'-cyclic-AMP phosphodiesterase [Steroidobacteraceae bacterium]|nr:3',5'-cyclic-AMP phosphodiesterase [Steroidobacteraceae bacterium]
MIEFTRRRVRLCYDPRMNVVRIVQFTDPHLYGDEAGKLRGVATYPALVAAIAHARARDWPPNAILATGDLVQDDPSGYATFRRAFGGLGVPVHCLPGNHDIPAAMRRELASAPFTIGGFVDIGAWRIVLLDSTVEGSAGGRLSDPTLAELDAALASGRERHALVCLHHHPVAMSSRWLDRVGLANPDALFSVLDAHRNVRAVLFGHVHQSFETLRGRVRLLATPSTCKQFLPRAEDFAVDERPPAYRTLELHSDGTLQSEVVWVDSCAARSPRSACSAA